MKGYEIKHSFKRLYLIIDVTADMTAALGTQPSPNDYHKRD